MHAVLMYYVWCIFIVSIEMYINANNLSNYVNVCVMCIVYYFSCCLLFY